MEGTGAAVPTVPTCSCCPEDQGWKWVLFKVFVLFGVAHLGQCQQRGPLCISLPSLCSAAELAAWSWALQDCRGVLFPPWGPAAGTQHPALLVSC